MRLPLPANSGVRQGRPIPAKHAALTARGWWTIAHAAIVSACYWLYSAGIGVLPTSLWIVLAWAWLIWPFALFFQKPRSMLRTGLPIAIALVVLAPCAFMLFAFTSWSVRGFAP